MTRISEEVYANKKHIVAARLAEKRTAIFYADLPSFQENEEKEATLWDKGINMLLTTYNIVSGRVLQHQITFYFMDGVRQLLESLFEAIVYLIAFLRTVFCVLLIIFGPLVFAISIFDGFQDNYLQWIARFINVNLYLPIALIVLALVQEVLIYVLEAEIVQVRSSLFYQPSMYYVSNMVVPVCGIVGLLMVPKIASWIMSASGTGSGGGRMVKTAAMMMITKGTVK